MLIYKYINSYGIITCFSQQANLKNHSNEMNSIITKCSISEIQCQTKSLLSIHHNLGNLFKILLLRKIMTQCLYITFTSQKLPICNLKG